MGTKLAPSLCFPSFLLPNLAGLSLSCSVREVASAPPLNLSLLRVAVPQPVPVCLHTSQLSHVVGVSVSLPGHLPAAPSVNFYL